MGQMGKKLGKNLWKMGIKSEQKLGKLLNKHGFPFFRRMCKGSMEVLASYRQVDYE